MRSEKPTPTQLANQLEEHAKTAEIIFGKQYRSDTERQSAAELRRLEAVNRELLETLIMVRDADDDAIMDCISRMPELARAKVDAAIAKATDD